MTPSEARDRYLTALAALRGYPYPERHELWGARFDVNQPELDALANAPDPSAPPFHPGRPAGTPRTGIPATSLAPAHTAIQRFDTALARVSEQRQLNAFIGLCPPPVSPVSGPLSGMLVGIKDIISVRDMPRTAGSLALTSEPAAEDAPCVARLREAGALIVGTLNMHELAYGITSVNPHYGTVVNPRAPARIAGGSSGGSAAAVAAGIVDTALGTDTAGSIRIPAACCGVVGFKPTYGAVSTEGVLPLGWSLDHVGPITRNVADAAAMFDVMAGGPAVPTDEPDDHRGWTLVRPADFFFEQLAPAVRERLERALSLLHNRGIAVVERPLPLLDHAAGAQFATLCVEATQQHMRLIEHHPERLGEDVRVRLEIGQFIPGVDYQRAQRLRGELDIAMHAALERCDALVTPTLPVPAPPVGATAVEVAGRSMPVHTAATRCTAPFNLTGMPAVTLPCGTDDSGAPIGLQLAGRRGEDARLLRLALEVETLIGEFDTGGWS
ncbi:amidase [Arhodomonas sp. KWT2]|uniref:amidase n=1 Tax=unclassified Arhodomonas TaxID=2621637 RepID=UPI0013D07075|nr:amidase [Arhodomonas sp. KWT]